MISLIIEFDNDRIAMLERKAIGRIRLYSEGVGTLWTGFSGGKDSIVLKKLILDSGVPAEFHYSMTTIDPPELIHYMKEQHKDIQWNRPKAPYFHEMVRRGLPMRPHSRWCCHEYKEAGPASGKNKTVALGVRWAESPNRVNNRQTIQQCYRDRTKTLLHPILEWTDNDVWCYIHRYELPYCSLYDEGFKRLGCIGCPFASQKARDREFERYPRFTQVYRMFVHRMYHYKIAQGKTSLNRFEDAEHLWLAWKGDVPWPKKITESSYALFNEK